MQDSQRLDQRLRVLKEEVRTMTQEKECGEQVWWERLQRCQRQLQAKEDEISRQSQYFENFKSQLQQKLSLARDREQSLQNRIYTLEKQLLDMTVSAATGMTGISATRITAGTVTRCGERERLPPMRGEGEGEEERKEEKRKQWQPSECNIEKKQQENQNSNEVRLQGFILSLQEDLQVLLEREEDGTMKRRELTEQLQEAQENSHLLGCTVGELKVEVEQLKRSESSLLEEVEELREENYRLLQIIRDAASQTSCQSSEVPESTCLNPGSSFPAKSTAVCPEPLNTVSLNTAIEHPTEWSFGKAYLTSNREKEHLPSSAASPFHHQATAECTTEDHTPFAKLESPRKDDCLKLCSHTGSRTDPHFQSPYFTTETLDEFKIGTWCSKGILNLEERASEESDALREAYMRLGFGDELEALKEERDRLEVALQHTQEQLEAVIQEKTRLTSQLRKDENEKAEESSREKINKLLTNSRAEGDNLLALTQDDLVQALNQENRTLADRITEFLAHIELREEEISSNKTHLIDSIHKLEADVVRLEQENQEQGGLITELTKKTEDDLNTIMELQQRFEESGQHTEESLADNVVSGSQLHHESSAGISGCFQSYDLGECVVNVVQSVLKEGEPELMSSQKLVPKSQQITDCDLLQNSQQFQSLKTQHDELLNNINSLREQQREAALSVKTQTEVKQQLTRTVWGLKEEKDSISQSLAGVRQEKEQLTRTICGLRDERDQLLRSMSNLRDEREQLTKCLSGLKAEKETLFESVSSGKEERHQIFESLQSLRIEREQLNQAVLDSKQERNELTAALKSLREQRDEEQSRYTLQEEQGKLEKSVSRLREEKERIEQAVRCLKHEETQTKVLLKDLREERNSLQAENQGQIQTEGRNQRLNLMNTNSATTAQQNETQRYQLKAHGAMQEESDLLQENEALKAELMRSQDELVKRKFDTHRLQNELQQSEARVEEAEIKASHATDKLIRLMDVTNQMGETRKENDCLSTQVKELQSKLKDVLREKTDALSLKAQIEEQYNILIAQLKAKTVALEELNSAYITLRQGQDSKEDAGTVLVSLRTHYNDVRAKYDALLKKRSQNDLDVAPLKAKLSCLVMKCQERNGFIAQMMKAMHRQGHMDPSLTQQVEELLSDPVLQDYIRAFTPGCRTLDCSTGFTSGFISKLQDYTSGFTPDQSFSTLSPLVNQQYQNVVTPESAGICKELKSPEMSSATIESTSDHQNISNEVLPSPTATLMRDIRSPLQEHVSVEETSSAVVSALEERSRVDAVQRSPSATGPIQRTRASEKLGNHQPDLKGKSFPDLSKSSESSHSPTPLPFTRVSVSRRMSSPEKILNLQEQLQKTLKSSYQAPVNRGRGQQPRKCLSYSAPAVDLGPASLTKTQCMSDNKPQTNSNKVPPSLSKDTSTPAVTGTPEAKTTLYTAVTSRSVHVKFRPNILTNHHFKADISKSKNPALSCPSFTEFDKAKYKLTKSPKVTKKDAAPTDISDVQLRTSTPLPPRTTSFDSDVLICSDTNPKNTASDTAAPEVHHLNTPPKTHGAAFKYDRRVAAASWTQPAHCSPMRHFQGATKSTIAQEKTKTTKPKPGAPAEVRSVEVIKTVGQSSLLIGWERPPLDELGCSNGTFVYGYRVFVDGDFHKSVMSSACTKCILENVDLSVPVHISVQTLGSNGLSSDSVHALYRSSDITHHD
ncbi:myosin-2 heavy chain-like isoform X2 [Cheilinus undulatus]|uniref:myosin-2 heavy chain-like isoform X2 n=1 Tax=Cheilinus undulatus TaxID=241271 RepID=UPI001BD259E9|nr:myosin-2 heavy chain-like isoform X2 [Cheilinus undulatus]